MSFIDPLEDITVNVLPRTLTEDLTSAQLDSMVYDRLRSLTVSAGGPADMVPEYVKPPSVNLYFTILEHAHNSHTGSNLS